MMRQILPYPLLSLGMLILWLLLQQSLGLGQILLGSVVALFAGRALAALQPEQPRIRRPFKIIHLMGLVAVDVLWSNLAVARIVLQGRHRKQTAGFLLLPLELRDRSALAILACIITATPGSAWLEYDAVRGTVLIHVLDLVDDQEWIDTIKHRYERLLLEIFQ
ncbi:multisubunit potassium/proton antiporter, PhaE subunit (TC 2.A.63.1.1) [Devosia psychrophila]|uniref:Multisubunit potassium/proton antiporter, PhaE subunit (TC 2.A.63.1.1) n=2 Tax=Devosia psychrophila TaxID=728005 RepID=A0A1I1NLP3_9HYPH|nr:multisubunit potassium/proton antiporter, PhaE subunit (TC 2.A.63.1.1) [Devosia psychrophila]